MIRAISNLRRTPDKQAAYDAARQRGSKLGMQDWVIPRESIDLGTRLGEGGFGVVFKCKHQGEASVAKQIAPAKLSPKDLPLLQNEMCLWAQLDHCNCVKFHGVCFEPKDYYYLICEYMSGGSLYDRHMKMKAKARRAEPVPMPQLLAEMRQVAMAVEHLHSKNIVHRDLKSANVLIAGDGRLCVGDFGLVRYCARKDEGNMTAETGSYRWMAPEVIRHEPYGTGCDVYSYGILCWEMLTLSIPFPHATPVEVALSVATKGLRPEIPVSVPPVLAELVQRCWAHDARQRPAFEQVSARIDAIDAALALKELPAAPPAAASPRASSPPTTSPPTVPVSPALGEVDSGVDGRLAAPPPLFAPRPQLRLAGSRGSPSPEASPEHNKSPEHPSSSDSLDGSKAGDSRGGDREKRKLAVLLGSNGMKRPKSVDTNLCQHASIALQM